MVIPAAASTAPAACAAVAADGPHAGLVVDTGSGGATTYCVALDGDSVNGLHLIALASSQYRLSYRLGFGGLAVCQLEGVGPDGDDCFADYPDFWGYWHHTGDTGWSWAATGAGSAQVEDGDMDAWTWGSGDTGDTHPAPPALAFEDVCVPASEPPPTTPPPPKPKPSKQPTQPPPSAGATGGAEGSTTVSRTTAPPTTKGPSEEPAASDEPTFSPDATTSTGSSASPAVAVAANPAAGSGGGSGPWLGALLAMVAVAVFAVGGFVRLRAGRAGRRRASGP
jgi:hypothetical protein